MKGLTKAIIFISICSFETYGSDPFSNNSFVNDALKETDVNGFFTDSVSAKGTEANPNEWYFISDLSGVESSFENIAFSPFAEDTKFDVNLYTGTWYMWGDKIKLPFYFGYAETQSQNAKEDLASTLLDKNDGLQLSIPLYFTISSSTSGNIPASRVLTGFELKGFAKRLESENKDKYSTGYNASFIFKYYSHIEIFNVGEGSSKQNGYLNLGFNYTYHSYSNKDVQNLLADFELLNTDSFSPEFTSMGLQIEAEIGKVISFSYRYEKTDDPILGKDSISHFTVKKRFN